ncbi:phosphoadenosine phosphosulfate reductase family protein [Vibrio rotiferianus]
MKIEQYNQYNSVSNTATKTKGDNLVHVVSFSGGRTSAVLVWLMKIAMERYGWNVTFLFCDTGVEHPNTYKFIRDIIKFWGIELVILRAKVNPVLGEGNSYEVYEPKDLMNSAVMEPFQPFMDMMIKYGTPSISGPYCSERMKKDVCQAYCNDHIGRNNYVTWLGMRSDEPDRLTPKDGIKYLADLLDIEKSDVLRWWKQQPFDLDLEEYDGNCIYCVKKSTQKLAAAIRSNPGFFQMWKYKIRDKRVRVKDGYDPKVMYRGKLSLEGIAAMYDDVTDEEIIESLRGSRGEDVGSCSESCEGFIPETAIDFDATSNKLYQEFEAELGLGQFELELI